MVWLVTENLNLNRILLLAIGVWPYHQSKLVHLQVTLCYSILISFIVAQLASFMTTECTPNFVVNILSKMLYFCFYIVNYFSFGINNQVVRDLLDQIQYIYNELRDEKEIAIIESYGYKAERYTITITLYAICCLIVVIVRPWLPLFLSAFFLVNASRPSIFIISEYFVDQERYLYLILLHINVVVCLGTFVLVGTGTTLIACIQCICAVYKVASYRIERIIEIDVPQTIYLKDEIMIYNKMIYAVDIHRKAMMLIKFLFSNFESSFFCMFMCFIICLTLNLFQIFQFISFGSTLDELILHLIIMCAILIYIFIFNYFAQEILDHNNEVFATVYHTRWYMAPLHIQKMILFLLQRGTKVFILDIGGLFSASLESTATLLSISMSYFSVLCSTRH